MPHKHKPLTKRHVLPFIGPLAGARRPNPAAHGNVTERRMCRCGATQLVNVRAGHFEFGPWLPRDVSAG